MPPPDNNISLLRERGGDCSRCWLNSICLPMKLSAGDTATFDRIVQRPRALSRGDYLFQSGMSFRSIYAIRTGAIKLTQLSSDGIEHVTGFHLPGEVIGLDALAFDRHPTSAVALDTTALCEIPFDRLEELGQRIPELQRQLLRLTSRELFAEQEMSQILAKRTAEERLASVLLDFSRRCARRGLSASQFCLPMSRHDLGSYLGLAPETMSRLFKRMQEDGLLLTRGKDVGLLDMARLHALAGTQPAAESDRGAFAGWRRSTGS